MSAPIRNFFLIKRAGRNQFFDSRVGMWWNGFANATQFASESRCRAVAEEWCLSWGNQIEIAHVTERTGLDTQIDDGDDPNAGEDWKK